MARQEGVSHKAMLGWGATNYRNRTRALKA